MMIHVKGSKGSAANTHEGMRNVKEEETLRKNEKERE